MAAMVARGSSQYSSISVQEKGSRNKRKFLADPPVNEPDKLPVSQIECPNYEFSVEKSLSNLSLEPNGACNFYNFNHDQPDAYVASSPSYSGIDRPRDELEIEESEQADWSELTETELEELVLINLDTIFKSAIKKISSYGYSEEVVTKAVLRSGLCYGCKDTVSNIVDNTLAFLRNGQEVDSSRDHFFSDLQHLEKYILAEMVCVLKEVRPFFSTGDAMWCLLICDMNVSHACAMDGDPLNNFGSDENLGSSSVSNVPQLKSEASSSAAGMPELNNPRPNNANPLFSCPQSSQSEGSPVSFSASGDVSNVMPNLGNPLVLEGLPPEKKNSIDVEQSLAIAKESTPSNSQFSALEEKPGGGKKSHMSNSKKESILRQKTIHLEKSYRAYRAKGALRNGKISSLGGLFMDKKCKPFLDSTSAQLKKSASLKMGRVGVDTTITKGDGNPNISINPRLSSNSGFNQKTVNNSTSSSSMANTELSLSWPSKSNAPPKPTCDVENANCTYPEILSDKVLEHWVPNYKKDEMVRKLVQRVQDLQTQLQEWREWGEEKVMQAARRLSKDNAELKTLRQEKEEAARVKKEKQTLEENTLKKLSEMENALAKASGQVEWANAAVRRLEVEKSQLRRELEAAKLRAAESDSSCQEVSRRQKKTSTNFQPNFQSWDKQKALFLEELTTEKSNMDQLQRKLEQAKEFHDQLEAKWKQEEKGKDEALMQANSERKEREQVEASAKLKEDMIRFKAESDLQRYRDDIRSLENEISQLRLKTDSSKIAALRKGMDGSHTSRLTDGRNIHALKDSNKQYISDMTDFQDSGDVPCERECVMCLTEEMSVVFLPCAHQIVCSKCNGLHEKRMKDCPSCRAFIQQRICVRFADS